MLDTFLPSAVTFLEVLDFHYRLVWWPPFVLRCSKQHCTHTEWGGPQMGAKTATERTPAECSDTKPSPTSSPLVSYLVQFPRTRGWFIPGGWKLVEKAGLGHCCMAVPTVPRST
jgi:hypothetical protein